MSHSYIKNVSAFALSLMLVVGMATPFAAQAQDTSLINSGDDAHIYSNTSQNSNTSVSNTNTANVSQNVHANVNTGGNSMERNIGGGNITTGAAAVGVGLNVQANKNTTALSTYPALGWGLNNTDVVNTGDGTHVNTSTTSNNNVTVANNNNANAAQYVHANATTGNNSSDRGIGGGSITTGPAQVGVSFDAMLNSNNTGVSGSGAPQTGLVNNTTLTNTGDDAWVRANASSNTNTSVSNSNYANVRQHLFGNVNTGDNSAERDIGGSNIMTGSAVLGTSMSIAANSNATGVEQASGISPVGYNLGDIVNTGDNLHSSTRVSSSNNQTVTNLNELYASQSVYSHTSTGNNSSERGIGGLGSLWSGNAGLGTNFQTQANSNWTLLGMSIPAGFWIF